MAGVVVLVLASIPTFPELPPNVPLAVVVVASIVQSGVLVALACWLGAVLAPRVGLVAPAFEALVRHTPVTRALAPQWRLGALSGVAGGIGLIAVSAVTPSALAESGATPLPLAARVLYGGITEELLLRWGFMSLVAWLLWRLFQRGGGDPRPALMWTAIIVSALVFGAGHLPAAASITPLTMPVVTYIVLANAALGVLFGCLFWWRGLEAAMLAHGLSHVVAQLIATMLSRVAAIS
ncbi:MAG: CPBP family intramembrane metalloprotease [Dehalococcoidia bacterium]|nr:CPBP family intramembrane metalloprotease [Dehalococcoidia bacterium]